MTESLTVAGAHVPPGERRDLNPLVSESYTGDRTTLPMAVVNGEGEGPTVFVTAAIHGDELNGIAICQQLLSLLDPAELRGAVIVVPIANVMGAQIRSRYLPDRRDLNRSFPGTTRGSMASRIARILHEDVVLGSVAGVDLHTAAETDDVDDTVDYGAVALAVASAVRSRPVSLLERVASIAGAAALAVDARTISATVSVRKLRPPVPLDIDTTGVRLTVTR